MYCLFIILELLHVSVVDKITWTLILVCLVKTYQLITSNLFFLMVIYYISI